MSTIACALAGCGRKGPLELPPGTPETQSQGGDVAQQDKVLGNADPGLIQSPNKVTQSTDKSKLDSTDKPVPRPINGPATARHNTFFLDPLL